MSCFNVPLWDPCSRWMDVGPIYQALVACCLWMCCSVSQVVNSMFDIVPFSFTVITHRDTNTHCHTLQHGLRAAEKLTNNSLPAGTAQCQGSWVVGLVVTFQQPFRVPRAEQAQGVLPRLNPQLKKKARPAMCWLAFAKTSHTCRRGRCMSAGWHLSAVCTADIRGLEQRFYYGSHKGACLSFGFYV